MKHHPSIHLILAFATLVSLSGCASIMSGTRKNISINSEPPGAHVVVTDRKNREVASLTTPCVANLKRSDGFYVGASYTATIEKPGYQSQQVKIEPTFNPWVLGNVVAGGLVGILIIDPATGACFQLTPEQIHAQLLPVAKR